MYIKTARVPFFVPKTAAAKYTANVASEIGTAPIGIVNGANTQITAAKTPVKTISFVFITLYLPPQSLIFLCHFRFLQPIPHYRQYK